MNIDEEMANYKQVGLPNNTYTDQSIGLGFRIRPVGQAWAQLENWATEEPYLGLENYKVLDYWISKGLD